MDISSLSSSQPTIPSSLSLPFQITSGFETASLLSEEPATISDSAANFSRVYSPSSIASNSSIQLPEYFLKEFSRPPSPNHHEYPIRVNSKIVRTLNEDPRYTVLPARFINNSSLSTQRKRRELRRLQEQQLTLKFEVEVTFNSLGPHPFSLSTRVAHKTTPSPFILPPFPTFVTQIYLRLEQDIYTFLIPTQDSIIDQYFNHEPNHLYLLFNIYNTSC